MKNLSITLLLSIFLLVGVTAQEMETIEFKEPGKFSLGLNIGASQSDTDVHSFGRHGESLFSEAHIAYGLTARYAFSPSLSLKANVFKTDISGDDANLEGPCDDLDGNPTGSDCHLLRGWSFESPLIDFGLDLEWELLGKRRSANQSFYDSNGNMVSNANLDLMSTTYYNKNGEAVDATSVGQFKKTISPYVSIGANLALTDPVVDFGENVPTGQEATWAAEDAAEAGKTLLFWNAGVGLRMDLSQKIFVDLEARGTAPSSDLLDGIAALTSNVAPEFNNEDSYQFLFVRLGYRFGGIGDTDGDGVNDNFDKCPNLPGDIKSWGCPDTDGDGIIDSKDACPNVPGVKRMDGCPDSDGDNVADSKDKCPEVAGLVRFDGCPDSDGDGIPDNADDCPTVAGEKEYNGCLAPDTDGDGVIDRDDKCVNTPGTVRGCPDTDGDGIIDMDDKCPKVKGIASMNGCPAAKKVVTRRPTTTVVRPVLLTCETIYFNTNQSSVGNNTKDRYLDAKENVSIFERAMAKLNENQSYRAVVQGHTDSRNTDEYNQKLSERRANEVLEGMITRGFPGTRTSAVGYGESTPVATNDTKAGRAQNRRVEICIYDR